MTAYYNENDPQAVAWLNELIKRNLICDGYVDERSIEDITRDDLDGFDQCHFFAGIGVWSHALRNAGWPDDSAVWTGSCPCQSFSASGKRQGFDDKRHLWPAWFWLIKECRPDVVFGEQVASKDGLAWLDTVSADLEGEGYTVGAADLCAAGFGAPHIRQRLYFVADRIGLKQARSATRTIGRSSKHGEPADSGSERRQQIGRSAYGDEAPHGRQQNSDNVIAGDGAVGGLAHTEYAERRQSDARRNRNQGQESRRDEGTNLFRERRHASRLADATDARCDRTRQHGSGSPLLPARPEQCSEAGSVADSASDRATGHTGKKESAGQSCGIKPSGSSAIRSGSAQGGSPSFVNGYWADAAWIYCRDKKYRPVEPGTFPLASGSPARVGRLRGYGNSLCAPVAEAFIKAWLETK